MIAAEKLGAARLAEVPRRSGRKSWAPGDKYDRVHSVERALKLGSLDRTIPANELRRYLIAVQRGLARFSYRSAARSASDSITSANPPRMSYDPFLGNTLGSSMVNVVPASADDSAQARPPCACAICATMNSPSPTPLR